MLLDPNAPRNVAMKDFQFLDQRIHPVTKKMGLLGGIKTWGLVEVMVELEHVY